MADKSQNLFGAFQHEQQFHKIFESIFFFFFKTTTTTTKYEYGSYKNKLAPETPNDLYVSVKFMLCKFFYLII